jgi:aspartate racemase
MKGGVEMARIGMIGGLGPESTVDFYRRLLDTHERESGAGVNPEIVIYSMDINRLLSMIGQGRLNETLEWILEGIKVLHGSGADFGFISSNTPHIIFDKLKEASPIPLISIVEETRKEVEKRGIKKAA